MKKISGTIAMVLVLMMLASCFTGWAIHEGNYTWLLLTIPLDIITFPIQLIGFLLIGDLFDASSEKESQIYFANAEDSPFTEYYPLVEKIYSLPESEFASLRQTSNSIPETERISSIERLISLSETKRVSLVSAYNSLPEKEIVSSIKRINSLTETELVSLLQAFKSLSEEELDSLIEELESLHETVE